MALHIIFIIYLYYVSGTFSLQCYTCNKEFPLTVPEIDINKSNCDLLDASHASCSQRLHIRYAKNETSLVLQAHPSELLTLTNEAQIMTNTTLIWLKKVQIERIFQIDCFNDTECQTNTINRTYVGVRHFEYSELWAYLVTRLYNVRSEPNKLTCADDQDKPVPCSEGFCQLISHDLFTFSRSCVPKGAMHNPYGVILVSKTIPGIGIQSSITYTCNQPMCNNLAMAKEILHLLEERELLSPALVTTTTTTTLSSTTTSASSSVNEDKHLEFYILFVFMLTKIIIF